MRRDHHPVGLLLAHVEDGLEHADHELARRVVVVEQNDLVEARPLRLGPNLGARLGDNVRHRDLRGACTRRDPRLRGSCRDGPPMSNLKSVRNIRAYPARLAWVRGLRLTLWQRQRDAPDLFQKEAAEPGSVMTDAQGISPFAYELRAHRVGGGIDLREWHIDRRGPDEAVPHRKVPALPFEADVDGGNDAVRPRVDAGHRSIALIERPDTTLADRDEVRRQADLDLRQQPMASRIDARDGIALRRRDPYR